MQRDVLAAMQEAGARALYEAQGYRANEVSLEVADEAAAVLRAALPVLREAVEGMRVRPSSEEPERWMARYEQAAWSEAIGAVLALLNDGEGER